MPVEQEAVEGCLKVLDRGCVDFDQEAVFAGNAVTLRDLGQPGGQLGNLGKLPGGGADTGERSHRQSERGRVNLHLVSGDDTGSLHALNALGHGRSRHAHATGQGRHGDARLGVELTQQPAVDVIEQS